MKPVKLSAVKALAPNSKFAIDADGVMINYKLKNGDSLPTEEEIQTKLTELQAEYDAQEYARKRQNEYPNILELVVALYDTDDKSAIEAKRAAVKLKYPKPE